MSGPRRIRDLPSLQPVQEARSQTAVTVGVLAYSGAGALVLVRALLLAVGIDRSFWAGEFVLGLTDTIFSPLSRIPIASTGVVGNLTLLDLTAVVGVLLVPIGLLAFASSHD